MRLIKNRDCRSPVDVSPRIHRKKWRWNARLSGQGVVLEGRGGRFGTAEGSRSPHPTLWAAITHRIFAAIFRENPSERLARERKMSEGLENRWVCIKHLQPTHQKPAERILSLSLSLSLFYISKIAILHARESRIRESFPRERTSRVSNWKNRAT